MRVTSLNRPKEILAVRRMLLTDHTVTPEQLQDETTQLNRLMPPKPRHRVEA